MDTESIHQQIRQTVEGQMRLAAADTAAIAAGEVILSSLEPALRQAAISLADQAAKEIDAQLPGTTIEVVLVDGNPTLRVLTAEEPVAVNTDDLDARMTVRLPEDLKDDLEIAASELGDSVNTFVVRALAGSSNAMKQSSRATFKGTIET